MNKLSIIVVIGLGTLSCSAPKTVRSNKVAVASVLPVIIDKTEATKLRRPLEFYNSYVPSSAFSEPVIKSDVVVIIKRPIAANPVAIDALEGLIYTGNYDISGIKYAIIEDIYTHEGISLKTGDILDSDFKVIKIDNDFITLTKGSVKRTLPISININFVPLNSNAKAK